MNFIAYSLYYFMNYGGCEFEYNTTFSNNSAFSSKLNVKDCASI